MNNSKNSDTKQDRSPAMQFYFRQFAGDECVMAMDLDTVGAHILLMCAAGASESGYRLACDWHAVGRILRNPTDADFERIKAQLLAGAWKVSPDGKWLIQDGMRRTLQKQKEFSKKQSENAKSRWEKSGIIRHDSGIDLAYAKTCSSSSSSSSSSDLCISSYKDPLIDKILNVDIPKGAKTPLSKALDMWAAHLLKKYNKVFDEIARDALMMTRGSNPLELAEDILYSIANGWKTINRKPMTEKARIETQVAAKVAATKEPPRPAPKVYVPPPVENVTPEAVAKFKESLKNIGNLPRSKDQKEGH